jgi:hypothetical protein
MIEKPPIIQSKAQKPRVRTRTRALLAGIACYRDHSISFDCTIRDQSEDGAKLRLSFPVPVPSRFYLIHIREGTAYDAEVIWSTGKDIGVKWLERISLSEPGPKSNPLRRLWLARS